MDLILKPVTPATELAVTTTEARDQLNIDDGTFDSQLELLIDASTKLLERHARIAIMPQTWLLETECLERDVELPRPPLIEIDSVYGKQLIADEWEAVESTDYTLQSDRSPARLVWVSEQPTFVKVQYQAGYADADSVPADHKLCILQLMTFVFENKMDVEAKMPIALKAMIDGLSCGTVSGYYR